MSSFPNIRGFGFWCLGLVGCGPEVNVRLLSGDNRVDALTDAAASDARTDRCADTGPCSGLAPAVYFKAPYDRVEVANSPLLDVPQDFAIEAWVFVKRYTGGHEVMNRWTAGVGDLQLTFGIPEPLGFKQFPSAALVPSHVLGTWAFVSFDSPEVWISTVAPTLPSVGAWHHLASSYGGGSLRLYVDGSRAASADSIDRVANAPNTFFIGASSRSQHPIGKDQGSFWWPPIDGYIAEVRISSNNRYSRDFVPEPHLVSDAATIALWHLDEGGGDVAFDSGPNHLNGTIVGPQWIQAPTRPRGIGP